MLFERWSMTDMFQNSGFIKIDFAYFASSWNVVRVGNIFVARSWIVGSLFCFLLLINLSPFDRINFAISVLLFPLFSPIDEGLNFIIRITWFAGQIVAYMFENCRFCKVLFTAFTLIGIWHHWWTMSLGVVKTFLLNLRHSSKSSTLELE